MRSKLFLTAKLFVVICVRVFAVYRLRKEFAKRYWHSDTPIQASSSNLNSKAGERMISYPEVISKNNHNSGLRLPDPSIMLFVGVSLIALAVWAKRRVKRAAR
jgi:hypothetical protein